ncbi:hypothetical protein EXIGLDRAFT_308551 [Exidia glandulosa HHB12029]|uniref:Uncharacterized protein n=1 Tax=Exidia glandulosa HHB12029 TaxID=1314781 RepID=A0A165LWH2_EXIGL|nr:hypothetical protein EXIGLDRAFT_308551 [Exidia glandulosa HHB12029]
MMASDDGRGTTPTTRVQIIGDPALKYPIHPPSLSTAPPTTPKVPTSPPRLNTASTCTIPHPTLPSTHAHSTSRLCSTPTSRRDAFIAPSREFSASCKAQRAHRALMVYDGSAMDGACIGRTIRRRSSAARVVVTDGQKCGDGSVERARKTRSQRSLFEVVKRRGRTGRRVAARTEERRSTKSEDEG